MSRATQVQKKLKNSPEYEAIAEIAEDADNYAALKAVADQRGGELLVDSLIADTVRDLENIANNAATLTHLDIVALGTRANTSLKLARILTRASTNLKDADERLKEALHS